MTKVTAQALKQAQEVAIRENDDSVALLEKSLQARAQHNDFVDQWFRYVDEQIVQSRRAALEEATAAINKGFENMRVQFLAMKDAVSPGLIASMEEIKKHMERFKE